MQAAIKELTYAERICWLKATKLKQTEEKQRIIGAMDYDDWAIILPPEDRREIRNLVGPSGEPITDVLLKGYEVETNHPSGGFFGAEIVGRNYRKLLEMHPVYVDPISSLAGAYMCNFFSYRKPHWNPDIDTGRFADSEERYQLKMGIGGVQHFCQDLSIGLELGWSGILDKINKYERIHVGKFAEFYAGLTHIVLGTQNWISRHACVALELSASETDVALSENLAEIAAINRKMVTEPPGTFREACQWILWYQMLSRMFNGSGSLGALDQLLLPYYERDIKDGILSDEEASFHIACLLARDTGYIQLGGYNHAGGDNTNAVSFLVLDAIDRLKIPANIGVCVGEGVDPLLLEKSVEMQFENKNGIPKFLGIDNTAAGFERAGHSIELGYSRIYSGCHWSAVPGREYTMNDIIKINIARIFEVSFQDFMENEKQHSIGLLWRYFERHLRIGIDSIKSAIDFHMEHMHKVFPELVMALLCQGPIERGRDVTDGGVDLYNIGIDGAGIAVAADSFAALTQRVEREKRVQWSDIWACIKSNWDGDSGEKIRLTMKSVPRYGTGGTDADDFAVRISRLFSEIVREKPTPDGYNVIPGLFSWALAAKLGSTMGATPDGRLSGDPINHGSNPSPGINGNGASTAVAKAVASVQPGYGQAAPLQLDVDPGLAAEKGGVDTMSAVIRTHFALGGTQINLNVMDADKILKAYDDPSGYPDLIVRVTGFSAYFSSLSDEMRTMIVERVIRDGT
ncbi:MAG: formate acetyltransferase [Spirochaetales bacterium]|nr:formate acetyltransferase [Spirochaetales bacterium]